MFKKNGDLRKRPKRILFLLLILCLFSTAYAVVRDTAGKQPERSFFNPAPTGHISIPHNGRTS